MVKGGRSPRTFKNLAMLRVKLLRHLGNSTGCLFYLDEGFKKDSSIYLGECVPGFESSSVKHFMIDPFFTRTLDSPAP